jgi:hypothetical protein
MSLSRTEPEGIKKPVIHNIISIIIDDFQNYASLVGKCTKVSLENSVEMTEVLHKDLMGPGPKVLGPNLHENAR